MNTFYQFAINNVRSYIKNHPASSSESIDAFTFSMVLAIVFDMDKKQVINDIIGV